MPQNQNNLGQSNQPQPVPISGNQHLGFFNQIQNNTAINQAPKSPPPPAPSQQPGNVNSQGLRYSYPNYSNSSNSQIPSQAQLTSPRPSTQIPTYPPIPTQSDSLLPSGQSMTQDLNIPRTNQQIPVQSNQIPQQTTNRTLPVMSNPSIQSSPPLQSQAPKSLERPKYINPTNFQQSQLPKPQNLNELRTLANNTNMLKEPESFNVNYPEQLINQNQVIQINTYDILKLCIYIIPGISILLILFKLIRDELVMWHARQSVLTHVIWLLVILILNNVINLPLISGGGFSLSTIWNILLIGILIYAGAQAYIGKKWTIPVIYDLGLNFIEGKNISRPS